MKVTYPKSLDELEDLLANPAVLPPRDESEFLYESARAHMPEFDPLSFTAGFTAGFVYAEMLRAKGANGQL